MSSNENNLEQWYEKSDDDILAVMTAEIGAVKTDNATRLKDIDLWMRLYDEKTYTRLRKHLATGEGVGVEWEPDYKRTKDPLAVNVIKQIVDYAVNKIGRSYPTVKVLTSGADYFDRIKSKELEKLVQGCFYQGDLYPKAIQALIQGCILGTGAVKVVENDNRIDYEWVFPGELFLKEAEEIYGDPRTLFQAKKYDRNTLMSKFKKARKALSICSQEVEVWEAWRLPTGPEEGDGRHVILVPGKVVLLDEEWEHKHFPFAFFHYQTAPLGFWGMGLAKALWKYQYDTNIILRTIQANVKAGGNMKVLVERTSVVDDKAINNDLRGTVIKYTGDKPPQWLMTPTVDQVLQGWLKYILELAWQETGWSAQNAAGAKPAGINSGAAIRNWLDSLTERQVIVGKAWEDMFARLATLTLDAAERIYKREGEFVATYKHKGSVQKVSMEEAMMDTGEYEIEVLSASRLPDTPAGRLEMVQDFLNNQWIEKEEALELLDIPDILSSTNIHTSPRRLVEQRLDEIVRGGQILAPHDRMPLQLCLSLGSLKYLEAEANGAPPEILLALSNWLDQVQGLLDAQAAKAAEEQAAAQPAAPPPPDQAMPLDPAAMDPAMMDPNMLPPPQPMQ
jgi:hypothetical protein